MSQQNNQPNLQTPNLPTVVVQQSQQISVQQANTDAIGAGRGGTSIRGGTKKKGTNTARKPSTGGGRAKLPSLEKSNPDVLPQALNKMATDFFSQAQQLGLNTEAGSAMYKKYEDAMRAIRQHQVNNNQSTSYGISASPDQPSTSMSSPHSIPRSIASTTAISSMNSQHQQSIQQQNLQQQQQLFTWTKMIPPEYQSIHTPQQLINEINIVQEALSQPNIVPSVKQDYENRHHFLRAIASVRFPVQPGASGLGAVPHMPPQSPRGLMGPQVARSPMQVNAPLPRATMNTLGQNRGVGSPAGNDFNRIPTTTQQIPSSSPILQPTNMTSSQSQDGSMMSTNMQHQLGQMSSSLQQVPQSPITQSQSPQVMVLPQSPRTQQLHLQQLHPLSPRQQHSSQPLQSVTNEDLMEIDSDTRSSTLAQKTAETPAINTGVLQSSLNKIHPGHNGKTLASIYGSNAIYPETSTSNVVDVDMEDAGAQHLLPKRKVQQLVDQIDPKERLEPEILLEIADEFISSVASFACLLAKHRKSETLEVKDLQLHLERNWNIRIPGFASDEIRSVRKPVVSVGHQQKIAAVMQAKANKAMTAATGPSN
ncbi:15097_t:CDS:2 [Funneliformis mosseae]|uniref:TBP-associated factor 12 n=1 Tax=Funneliformis mosseae TaxID=27381 RepID=A0A9N8YZU2_FUNMO|nr:15097_t:CDS:2 [Funneliformis mosseae]